MNFKPNSKYFTIAVYAFLAIAAGIGFWAFVANFDTVWGGLLKILDILSPFIYGFIIAYLLTPVHKRLITLFEKICGFVSKRSKPKPGKEKKEPSHKLISGVAIVFTYLLFAAAVYLFVRILLPQVTESVTQIGSNFTAYGKECIRIINSIIDDYGGYIPENILAELGLTTENLNEYLDKAMNIFNDASKSVFGFFESLLTEVLNICIGVIISIYMLAGRNDFKKKAEMVLDALLPDAASRKVKVLASDAHRCFGGYIIGQLADSLLITVIWMILMVVFGFPFPFLISLIVGVTNIIPFFGPFIGGIPAALLVLLTEPRMAIWFVILLIVVQQIDGNVIAPRIIGEATGMSSFWVIFALLVFGGLFGIVGMIIAVPLFSLIYNEISLFIKGRLEAKVKAEDESEKTE